MKKTIDSEIERYIYALQFPQRKLIRDMGYNYDYLGRRIQKFIADGIIDQGTVFEVPTVLLSKKREEEIRKELEISDEVKNLLKDRIKGDEKKKRQLRFATTVQMLYRYLPDYISDYLEVCEKYVAQKDNSEAKSNEENLNIVRENLVYRARKHRTDTGIIYSQSDYPLNFKENNFFISTREVRMLNPVGSKTISSARPQGILHTNEGYFTVYNHLRNRLMKYAEHENKFKYLGEQIVRTDIEKSIHFALSYKVLLDSILKTSDTQRSQYILTSNLYDKCYYVPLNSGGNSQLYFYMIKGLRSYLKKLLIEPGDISRADGIVYDGISENGNPIYLGFETEYNELRTLYELYLSNGCQEMLVYCFPHQTYLYRTLFENAEIRTYSLEQILEQLRS